MNILLAAEESAGLRLLGELHKSAHRIVAVLAGDSPASAGTNVGTRARALGLKTLPAKMLKSPALAENLRHEQVDLFLNVHSLYVVHPDVLALPRIGAYNLHPGPLPNYAGLNAPSWAVYNGERSHAVTVHEMAARIDAGPIAFEHRFPVIDRDTGLSVALRCVSEGIPLMLRLLEVASRRPEDIPRRAQNLRSRRYYGKEIPQEGRIDWDRSAREVFNFVRACDYSPFRSPWGQPATSAAGRTIKVTKVSLTGLPCLAAPGTFRRNPEGQLLVACAGEWLRIERCSAGAGNDHSEILQAADRFESAVATSVL